MARPPAITSGYQYSSGRGMESLLAGVIDRRGVKK